LINIKHKVIAHRTPLLSELFNKINKRDLNLGCTKIGLGVEHCS